RSLSAGHRIRAGVHEPDLGDRWESARPQPRRRRVRPALDRHAAEADGRVARLAVAKRKGPCVRAVRSGTCGVPEIPERGDHNERGCETISDLVLKSVTTEDTKDTEDAKITSHGVIE